MGFKIYTKTGDTGETGLFGGTRVPKDHLRIEAYGTVDELNSLIGVLQAAISEDAGLMQAQLSRSEEEDFEWHALLRSIQGKLFTMGSQLATPFGKTLPVSPLSADDAAALETAIDDMDARLPALTAFILPGGAMSVSQAHVCRTVARRAERCVVRLSHEELIDGNIVVYLNRLSDYFFTLARALTYARGDRDTTWTAGR